MGSNTLVICSTLDDTCKCAGSAEMQLRRIKAEIQNKCNVFSKTTFVFSRLLAWKYCYHKGFSIPLQDLFQ